MVGDLLQADRVLEVPAKGNAGFGCKIHENGIKIDPSYELAAAKVKWINGYLMHAQQKPRIIGKICCKQAAGLEVRVKGSASLWKKSRGDKK